MDEGDEIGAADPDGLGRPRFEIRLRKILSSAIGGLRRIGLWNPARFPRFVPSQEEHSMNHASTARHGLNVEHFGELVEFCAGLDPARYHPIRLNLKIKALQDVLAAAQAAVAKVELAHAELDRLHDAGEQERLLAHQAHDRAREERNAILYAPGEGVVDLANDCKAYLKTLKGPKEPELHHITHLEFKAPA